MRTRRNFPRTISLLIIIFSLVTFYTGTDALAKRQREPKTPFDQFLIQGPQTWGLQPSSDPTCLGILHTNLDQDKKHEFSANGLINLRLGTKLLSARTQADFGFNSFLRLETFHIAVILGQAEVSFASVTEDPQVATLTIKNGASENTFRLPRPGPIYLAERQPGQFTLRLAEGALPAPVSLPTLSSAFGLEFQKLQPEAVASCEQNVKSLSPEKQKLLIDVGAIFERYRNGPASDILKLMNTESL